MIGKGEPLRQGSFAQLLEQKVVKRLRLPERIIVELVDADAERIRQLRQHGGIRRAAALPAGNGLHGDGQQIAELLLRQACFFRYRTMFSLRLFAAMAWFLLCSVLNDYRLYQKMHRDTIPMKHIFRPLNDSESFIAKTQQIVLKNKGILYETQKQTDCTQFS